MLSAPAAAEDRVTTAHRAKLAYIYVRQSSAGQVRHHQGEHGCSTAWSTGGPARLAEWSASG